MYFNCYSPSTKARLSSSAAVVTLLVERALVGALEGRTTPLSPTSLNPTLVELVVTAQQSGVEIDSLQRLYQRWQEQENGGRRRR